MLTRSRTIAAPEPAGEIARMEWVSDTPRPTTAVVTAPKVDPTILPPLNMAEISLHKRQRIRLIVDSYCDNYVIIVFLSNVSCFSTVSDVLSWSVMWIRLSNFRQQTVSSPSQISHKIYATGYCCICSWKSCFCCTAEIWFHSCTEMHVILHRLCRTAHYGKPRFAVYEYGNIASASDDRTAHQLWLTSIQTNAELK